MTEQAETIYKMVGAYTLVISLVIALSLVAMGFGWPWWLAGLGPIFLIPLLGWSWAIALDKRLTDKVK